EDREDELIERREAAWWRWIAIRASQAPKDRGEAALHPTSIGNGPECRRRWVEWAGEQRPVRDRSAELPGRAVPHRPAHDPIGGRRGGSGAGDLHTGVPFPRA